MVDNGWTGIPDPAASLRMASDVFLRQLRLFSELTAAPGVTEWIAGGVPGARLAEGMLDYLRSMAEQAPAPTAQLDTFLQEIRAKKALIGALRLQLAAFEQQMDLLEHTLAPLQQWAEQWSQVQQAITDALPLFHGLPDHGGPA